MEPPTATAEAARVTAVLGMTVVLAVGVRRRSVGGAPTDSVTLKV